MDPKKEKKGWASDDSRKGNKRGEQWYPPE
jgi:hypothetical protein